jgi:predicted RNase H-like HicB family nuclease
MRNEFTAVIERDNDWFVAWSPEIPGANGQGRSVEECRESLGAAIQLILEDRREDGLRGVPADALREMVSAVKKHKNGILGSILESWSKF